MSNSTTQTSSGGIGFCGLLAIVFIVLKLGVGNTVVMTWPWLWVLSPLWIPLAIVFGILGIALLVWLIASIIKGLSS